MFETITLLGGATVTVDMTNKGRCKKCKAEIVWAVTVNKTKKLKNMPICKNKNGAWISHFADCPYAAMFRKDYKKASAGIFDNEDQRQAERERWE